MVLRPAALRIMSSNEHCKQGKKEKTTVPARRRNNFFIHRKVCTKTYNRADSTHTIIKRSIR